MSGSAFDGFPKRSRLGMIRLVLEYLLQTRAGGGDVFGFDVDHGQIIVNRASVTPTLHGAGAARTGLPPPATTGHPHEANAEQGDSCGFRNSRGRIAR